MKFYLSGLLLASAGLLILREHHHRQTLAETVKAHELNTFWNRHDARQEGRQEVIQAWSGRRFYYAPVPLTGDLKGAAVVIVHRYDKDPTFFVPTPVLPPVTISDCEFSGVGIEATNLPGSR